MPYEEIETREERFDYDEQFECLPEIEFTPIIATGETINNQQVILVEEVK